MSIAEKEKEKNHKKELYCCNKLYNKMLELYSTFKFKNVKIIYYSVSKNLEISIVHYFEFYDVIRQLIKEKFRITFTTNGRNEHVTMLTLYLLLAVSSFSVKLSSFALTSKARIILHYSFLCTHSFKKT